MRQTFLTLLLVLFMCNITNAQWTIKNLNENSFHSGILKFKNDSFGIWMKSNCSVIEGVDKGSAILKTSDAGETWVSKPININFNFYDFQFVGDSAIFAICFHVPNSYNTRSILLKSNDLGENWDSIALFPRQTIETLHFFNIDTGFVAGFENIYRTIDGGNTWDTIFVSNYNYTDILHSCFPTAEKGYAIGIGGSDPHKPYYDDNILIKTEDKGATWNLVDTFVNKLSSIFFLDEKTGFLGNEKGIVYKTTDGGLTWLESQVSNWDKNVVRSIQFVSEKNGFATGSPREITEGSESSNFFITKTIDGGETWLSYDTLGIPLNCIYFLNDTLGFVSGDYELIMKTNGEIDQLPDNYPWHLAHYLGINKNKLSSSCIKIYPNPTENKLSIENMNPDNPIKMLTLINSSGQTIKSIYTDVTKEPISIDLSDCKYGMYLIKVMYIDRFELIKVIKK
jgi:photosystem II stability/assembly factor-like uncharacterized protein